MSEPNASKKGLLSATGVTSQVVPTGTIPLDAAGVDRLSRISEAAYKRAERRNFEPGHDLEDWLQAEREIDASIARHQSTDRTSRND